LQLFCKLLYQSKPKGSRLERSCSGEDLARSGQAELLLSSLARGEAACWRNEENQLTNLQRSETRAVATASFSSWSRDRQPWKHRNTSPAGVLRSPLS